MLKAFELTFQTRSCPCKKWDTLKLDTFSKEQPRKEEWKELHSCKKIKVFQSKRGLARYFQSLVV